MLKLNAAAATFVHDGTTYEFRRGDEIPDDLPGPVREFLERNGAVGDEVSDDLAGATSASPEAVDAFAAGPPRPDPLAVASGGAEGAPAPSGDGGAVVPEDAPNVSDASVAELAAYIDRAKPNAAQTVALAGGDPVLASKVLDAENTAHGGDGRKTVTEPLSKLAADGEQV